MNAKQLRAVIEQGENNTVEFKRKFSDFEKIAKELIAFANTRGGLLLIGVDDDGSIVGVDSEKHEIELVTTAGEFYSDPPIDTDIEVTEIDGLDVVVVAVNESSTKPHYLTTDKISSRYNGHSTSQKNGFYGNGQSTPQNGKSAYIRQGERSVMASKEVERVLAATHPDAPPLKLHIGKIEQSLFSYLETNKRVTLREFRHLVNISERRASRCLVRLVRAGLIRIFTNETEDYYTLA